jgi:hypothetical protein
MDDANYQDLMSLCTTDTGDASDIDEMVIFNQYDTCRCGEKMYLSAENNLLQCPTCPNMEPYINDEITGYCQTTKQYNSGSSSYCKIAGHHGARVFQRSMFPVTVSPEERRRKMVIHALSKLKKFNACSHDIRFPDHFLVESAEMLTCIQIANDHMLKDTVYIGTLIRCLSIVCVRYGLYQKDPLMCKYAGISQTDLTQRNKLIRDMRSEGIIEYEKYYDPSDSLLNQYFVKFDIPMEYKEFGKELIELATSRKLRGVNNNTLESKCAAVIAILHRKLGLNFPIVNICTECKIVQSTYEKFARYCVDSRDILKPLFKKYGISRLRSTDFPKKVLVVMVKPKVEKPKRKRGRPAGVKNRPKPMLKPKPPKVVA